MAAERTDAAPPALAAGEEKPQNPEVVERDAQDVKGATPNESALNSVFAVSEPVREEEVQNAVKFLSHPKVRGSPVIHRRSFLEKKGLTKEEIDEAFRRVPDPPSNVTSVETVALYQGSLQPQVSNQTLERVSSPTTGVSMVPNLQQSKFCCSEALFAVGMVAASAVGTMAVFKKVIVPWLKTWIRKVAGEDNETVNKKRHKVSLDEAAEAAKAAASAAVLVAKASQELLNAKNAEKKYFEAFIGMLDVQVKEMKSMSNAIHNLESASETINLVDKQKAAYIQSKSWNGTVNNPVRTTYANQTDLSVSSSLKHTKANGSEDMDFALKTSSSKSSTTSSAEPPHPQSYIEIIEMIQRGEKPSNIKDIDDTPPNPDQPITKPLLAPRPKPWEISQQTQLRPPSGLPSHTSNLVVQPESRTSSQINGYSGSFESSRKNVVKTDEVDHEAENTKQLPHGIRNDERSSNQHWLPPQPPSPWMPEAASAIRQPKSSIEKQKGAENLTVTSSNGENGQVRTSDSIIEPGSSYSMDTDLLQDQPAKAIDC